jgi:hypothetical protein
MRVSACCICIWIYKTKEQGALKGVENRRHKRHMYRYVVPRATCHTWTCTYPFWSPKPKQQQLNIPPPRNNKHLIAYGESELLSGEAPGTKNATKEIQETK